MSDIAKKAQIKASSIHSQVEFTLTEEQKEAVIECIKRTGKVTIQLRSAGTTQLPGRGVGIDFDGDLID